jgi:hypothetical protein
VPVTPVLPLPGASIRHETAHATAPEVS